MGILTVKDSKLSWTIKTSGSTVEVTCDYCGYSEKVSYDLDEGEEVVAKLLGRLMDDAKQELIFKLIDCRERQLLQDME